MTCRALTFTLPVSACILLSGCIYEYNSDIFQRSEAQIAVSGDIVIGGESRFCISNVLPISHNSKDIEKYPDADVFVECEDGSRIRAQKSTDGYFRADCSNLDPAKRYRVRVVTTRNRNYCSEWGQAIADPVIELLTHKYDDEAVYITADIRSGDNRGGYYRIDYDEVWEYHADFVPEYMYNIELIKETGSVTEVPSLIYRRPNPDEDFYNCWAESSNTEYILASSENMDGGVIREKPITSFRRTGQRCMYLYCINLHVRSLDEDAYRYLENIQKTANITPDLFTPVPSEIRGNVFNESDRSEPVYGYVTTSRVVSRRYFIQTSKIYRQLYSPESELYFPQMDGNSGKYGYYDLFNKGERPVKINDPNARFTPSPSNTNVQWGPGRCTDCRFEGGTKHKPDYWPNDDK